MTIFEKIINKEIEAYIVYEDDDVLAILDHSQITKGHTLVMPKKHAVNILDVSEEDLKKIISVTQKLAIQIKDKLNANGINILMNSNEVAGQTVMHYHVHIIPRYDLSDEITISGTSHPEFDKAEILNQIKG